MDALLAARRPKRQLRAARTRRAKEAKLIGKRLRRRVSRSTLGNLRDRVAQPRRAKRYEKEVKEFFMGLHHTWLQVLDSTLVFDTMLCVWAEYLLCEVNPKGIINGSLYGLAHCVPAPRGQLNGAWRYYKALLCREKPAQASL